MKRYHVVMLGGNPSSDVKVGERVFLRRARRLRDNTRLTNTDTVVIWDSFNERWVS